MKRLRISKAVVVSGLPADAATLLLLRSTAPGFGGRRGRRKDAVRRWPPVGGGCGAWGRRGGARRGEAEGRGAAVVSGVRRPRRLRCDGWTGAETAESSR
jgi:hypothetical protein